jgi:predicted nucleotidyltransferase/predicted DNA-binding transcriptional regulator
MSVLHEILSSRVRSEIFRLLFGASERQLHVREMERRTGLSVATVRQELQKLLRMQLVEAQRSGNRLYYWANKAHPLYPDIRNMVLKTAGMVDILRDALDKEGVTIAFVFGSVASNQEGARSDVDLMVIGDVGLRTLSDWLSGISEHIGREVNPHVMNETEFRRRRRSHDHFITRVLESEKLFIKGSEHDLEAMGA